MLGFRQDLGVAGSVQSVAAISIHPEAGKRRKRKASMRLPSTRLRRCILATDIDAEAGATAVMARLGRTVFKHRHRHAAIRLCCVARRRFHSAIPVRYHGPESRLRPIAGRRHGCPCSRCATARSPSSAAFIRRSVGSADTDTSGMAVRVYADNIENPVLEAMSHFAADDSRRFPPRCCSIRRAIFSVPPGPPSPPWACRPVSSADSVATTAYASAMPTAARL